MLKIGSFFPFCLYKERSSVFHGKVHLHNTAVRCFVTPHVTSSWCTDKRCLMCYTCMCPVSAWRGARSNISDCDETGLKSRWSWHELCAGKLVCKITRQKCDDRGSYFYKGSSSEQSRCFSVAPEDVLENIMCKCLSHSIFSWPWLSVNVADIWFKIRIIIIFMRYLC